MFRRFKRFFRSLRSRRLRDYQPTTTPPVVQLDPPNAHQVPRTSSESRTTSHSETSDPTIPQKHYNSAQELRHSLQQTCSWLSQPDLDVTGERAVDGGRYADVWRGSLDGRDVAVKAYRCYIHFDLDWVRLRFWREAHAYSRLSHRNIVPFVGAYSTLDHPLSLVFEFMERGNLAEYLRAEPNANKLQLVVGIARGLHHMRDLGVVHGNLESTNVLVDSDGTPRIAGLGSASIQSFPAVWSEDPPELTRCHAPELLNPGAFGLPNAQVTEQTDIYAFGVLAYEIFAGDRVFPGVPDTTTAYSMSGGTRPPRPNNPELSDRIWDMINKCWEHTPSQRITIIEAVSVLETELQKTSTASSLLPLLARLAP